ncbi:MULTISPECIES: ATP-binding protein [unclassified Variovorax]|uniref:sensor histidine kinase n=1 Tax=unclassified Variovorax TaxID=663243 RepID=UPI000838B2F1|nr:MULTISPECIES: ATP-binding protein [unclassified Variovorax]PNG56833.1 Sensor histidine kinase TmoS [Variovorax sp. B4]PNG58257.1 Sensor histidine kinase TmoS [Variovorax sp. B2]VTV09219.1 Sensor protein ZraS [Variovorax sp. WDL1]
MRQWLRTQGGWWLAWLLLGGAGATWIARAELAQLHEDFEVNGRIAHRLMSQQVVQYDAVLATLALLAPGADAERPEQRLSAVYPSILGVERREAGGAWSDRVLADAEARSRELRRPELAGQDLAMGRYRLVIGATPISYALDIDLAGTVPARDWPMDPKTSPVRVVLERAGQQFVVQPGRPALPQGWSFSFRKVLASDSQAFDLVAERHVSWSELPWGWMLAWAGAIGGVLWGARALRRQRIERRRAEELLRLGQVARLNALGELAAGMAHELNQPLTAVLANTQAARRLLDEEPPELATARGAMQQAAEQARRAADVVGRLRRVIERPGQAGAARPVPLQDAVRSALHLLAPEFDKRAIAPVLEGATQAPVSVQAEPVALEQIVHNLLMNALQALDELPAGERQLRLAVERQDGQGVLRVSDNGRGIAPELLARIFEPFFSTREGGLGLGLSLCETLAGAMGGSLSAEPEQPRGARFTLRLPLAPQERPA